MKQKKEEEAKETLAKKDDSNQTRDLVIVGTIILVWISLVVYFNLSKKPVKT